MGFRSGADIGEVFRFALDPVCGSLLSSRTFRNLVSKTEHVPEQCEGATFNFLGTRPSESTSSYKQVLADEVYVAEAGRKTMTDIFPLLGIGCRQTLGKSIIYFGRTSGYCAAFHSHS